MASSSSTTTQSRETEAQESTLLLQMVLPYILCQHSCTAVLTACMANHEPEQRVVVGFEHNHDSGGQYHLQTLLYKITHLSVEYHTYACQG
jgi:hypothetical protein